MKRVLFFFGAKTKEDLQQKGMVYISESKAPRGTIIRHSTIPRLLVDWVILFFLEHFFVFLPQLGNAHGLMGRRSDVTTKMVGFPKNPPR